MSIVADLDAEYSALDEIVSGLSSEQWALATPAAGWTIAHQIGHLLWTDRASMLAVVDPDAFAALLASGLESPLTFVDDGAEAEARREPAELLADWRATRSRLIGALSAVPDGTKVPWFGPAMSAASMMTARIMETWAHGLDVADALGLTVVPTDRIRNVAHIGVRTRDFAFVVNGQTPPTQPFGYRLTGPSGQVWTWGSVDAVNQVRGSAVDFCQLITQRRALADLDLEIVGDAATAWAQIAQCFAGPPGAGRAPMTQGAK